jgi:hypothetical protein
LATAVKIEAVIMDDPNAILDALQTEGLIKALSSSLDKLESKQFEHTCYHVLGRPLIRLLQQPDHDLETYKKLSRHLKLTILNWDEAALKKVAEDFANWFLTNPLAGTLDLLNNLAVLDPISSILRSSEWLWQEIFIDKALVDDPAWPLGFGELLLNSDDARAKFRKDKQWILRAMAKMPQMALLIDSIHFQDPDIMLAIMSSKSSDRAKTFRAACPTFREAIINWESKYREITVQKETFDLLEEIVAPRVLASNLNQGQEATSGLIRRISDYIGLPLEQDWPVLLKAHAHYEILLPTLRKAGENAPLRENVPLKERLGSQETETVEQLVTEVGDPRTESPLLPLNRRGRARVRRPVERFNPSS